MFRSVLVANRGEIARRIFRTVRRLTDNHGADVVVDSVGGSTLQGSINSLAYRGRVSMVGAAGRDPIWWWMSGP